MDLSVGMDVCTEAFTYTPLDDPECSIRILEVLPDLRNGQVQVCLRHSRMPASYRCLSYMWGDDLEGHEILVNNRSLRIRKNLYDFLETARRRLPGKPLWVDAICINQYDNIEKGHQVQRMGRVFQEASEVLVWLGMEQGLNYVFDFINSLVSIHSPLTKSSALRYMFSTNSEGVDIGLRRLCSHPYWSRAWIAQELLLAHHVRIMNESKQVEWRSLIRAIREVRKISLKRPQDDSLYTSPGIKFWEEWPWGVGQYHERRTIWHLDWVWSSHCFDPRDRIYSLLSLLESNDFKVNYEEDIYSLFWRAAEYFRAWNSAHSLKSLIRALNLDASTLEDDLRKQPTRKAFLTVASIKYRDEYDQDPDFCEVCGTKLKGMSKRDMSFCLEDPLEIRGSQHAILSPTTNGSFTISLRSSYKVAPRRPPHILGPEALQYFVNREQIKIKGIPTWNMDVPGSMYRIILPTEIVIENLKAIGGEERALRSYQAMPPRFTDDELARFSNLPWSGPRNS